MSFFDLISYLRTREPNVANTAKVMKVIGWFCILGGAWNYIVPQLMPFARSPFKLPPDYPVFALAIFSFLGGLFILSARGILNKEPWGRRLGQAAVVLLVSAIIGLAAEVFSWIEFPFTAIPAPVLIIFSVIFIGQFVAPAWFGIGYLGRLPVTENAFVRPDDRASGPVRQCESGPAGDLAVQVMRYKESPFAFGVVGTFLLLLAVPMLVMLIAVKTIGPQVIPMLLLPIFILVFVGPTLYNRAVSSFERERDVTASYTGGGSIFMFNGSWPFFRLLVYADGVGIRVMFHRFFIPYDRMEDLPEKQGFFSSGVPFRSDIPEVPSSIRFYAFRSKNVLAAVREQRTKYLAAQVLSGPRNL